MSAIFKNNIKYGNESANEREISWAEYQALSEEEKNNGTTYYVPDSPEGGGTAQATTYNNQNSGLKATNVQEAIDEIANKSGIYLEAVTTEVYVMNAEVID